MAAIKMSVFVETQRGCRDTAAATVIDTVKTNTFSPNRPDDAGDKEWNTNQPTYLESCCVVAVYLLIGKNVRPMLLKVVADVGDSDDKRY